MAMRRDLRIVLLSAGVVLGFGAGFHTLRMRAWQHQLAWERHFAASCVEAARGGPASSTTPPPPGFPGERPGRW
jgi:hypothetical protein